MSGTWIQAVALIISPLSITGLIFFLGRSAMQQYLARNLEAHKARLSNASELEIEKLKADLGRIAREHDVIFQRLHGERAEAIKNLFEKVRNLSTSAKRYAAREGVATAHDHDANRRAVEIAATSLNQAMLDARIFLSEELCARIQGGMHDVVGYATNVAGEFLPLRRPEDHFALMAENKENLQEAAWQMETKIAEEFRRLLGVK